MPTRGKKPDKTEIPRSTIRQKISIVDSLRPCIWYVFEPLHSTSDSPIDCLVADEYEAHPGKSRKKDPTSAIVYQSLFECTSLEILITSFTQTSSFPQAHPSTFCQHDSRRHVDRLGSSSL
ncbi:hypothetical protein M413DRAFT_194966 [Hebeloma cylindrosporum]|uniref:Uncharacterized protein n=1 Tax=Hebeloma cylindrosporum TaxID=76867 RepID=A0A0C2YF69_HEBCY|nr:hypothetical protein M413DRAFT_194966 [Hebeloma cylindrosporum h7]